MNPDPSKIYDPSFELAQADNDDRIIVWARLPILILLAILVVASFAGAVWLAYNQGVVRSTSDTPPAIAAPDIPIRTSIVEDSGSVPLAGLGIYAAPAPIEDIAENSTLATPVAAAPEIVESPIATSGNDVVQIGAYPTEALAEEAWTAFRAEHSEIAASLTNSIQIADLGEAGVWYRQRVGPFESESSAKQMCTRLKAEGGDCFLATQ